MAETKIIGGVPGPTTTGTPGVEALVDALFGSFRMSPRPFDYTLAGAGRVLGHYSLAASSGAATGIAAGGAIFSMQYADSASVLVLERLRVAAVITTAFTTAQAIDVDAIIERGFTAPDTGGAALSPLTGQKTRSLMGNSIVNDARIATTAALTPGTKTPDANPFTISPISQNNTLGAGQLVTLYELTAAGQHPVVLAKNEGLNVRVVTAMGAVGVVKYYVAVDWAELAGF